jgi:signal transduction histidine kinase
VRRRRPSPRTVDIALTAAVFIAAVTEALTLTDLGGPRWAITLVVASMSLLLLWRRTHPVAVTVALVAIALPTTLWVADATELVATFIPLLMIAYGGGRYASSRDGRIVLAILLVSVPVVGLSSADATAADAYFPAILVALCWFAGRTVNLRLRHAAELHESAALAAEQREREAQRAVADERRRIAREMHDVVAHSISIMVVQAGGARRILATDPARAEQAAASIRHAGSDALGEMDVLLGVLGSPAETKAPPTLDGLGELVERTRAAGLPAALVVSGRPQPLPADAELAVYRVVQEALTNAIKHAGGATTRVTLTWSDAALELCVADEGDGGASHELAGGGHGLVGMRERLRVHGGELEAGPRPGGGFQVSARLPLGRALEVLVGGGPGLVDERRERRDPGEVERRG